MRRSPARERLISHRQALRSSHFAKGIRSTGSTPPSNSSHIWRGPVSRATRAMADQLDPRHCLARRESRSRRMATSFLPTRRVIRFEFCGKTPESSRQSSVTERSMTAPTVPRRHADWPGRMASAWTRPAVSSSAIASAAAMRPAAARVTGISPKSCWRTVRRSCQGESARPAGSPTAAWTCPGTFPAACRQ